MRCPLPSLIFVALLTCTTPAFVSAEQREAVALPEALHCESVGLPHGEGITYDLEGASIVKTVRGENFELNRIEVKSRNKRQPSTKEWGAFWETLNRLRIQDWKSEYSPQQLSPALIIFDGHQWALMCRRAGLDLGSRGQNAYPDMVDPQTTTRDAAVFDSVIKALETLLNPPAQ